MSTHGQRFREVRQSLGLTQWDMSQHLARAGVQRDLTAISKMENDARQPLRLDEMERIAAYLGVPPTAFLVDPQGDESDAWRAGRKQGINEARKALDELR